jgi:hypothetical protein
VLLVLALATAAHADVDPSGTWELKPDPRFEGPPPRLVVHVDGTAAKVTMSPQACACADTVGTWEPATRTLHAGDPAFVGQGAILAPSHCISARIEAVVSADGATMSGDMTVLGGVVTSACSFFTRTLIATRATCGNFRIDAGEECDHGDVFAKDDCCSDTCTFEPAGAECSAHGAGNLRCPTPGVCPGGRDDCVPPPGDDDGDGLPNACDACDGGTSLSRLRLRTDGAALVMSMRVRRPEGRYSPRSSGPAVSFVGAAADARSVRLEPGIFETNGAGWKEPPPGRRWTYDSEDGHVTASLRVGRRFLLMKLTDRTPETVAAVPLARFVSVQLGSPSEPCGQVDLTSAACITRRHTTVCRPRARR